MNFPRRWQDCDAFIEALLQRKYVQRDDAGNVGPLMADGIYLYMYELWQDACLAERQRVCSWLREEAPSLAQFPSHLADAIEVQPCP